MQGTDGFAKIWDEAHRERSLYVWSIITRMLATPRRSAPKAETKVETPGLAPVGQH